MRQLALAMMCVAALAGCAPKGNVEDKSPFLAFYSAIRQVVKAKFAPKDAVTGQASDSQAALAKAIGAAKGPIIVGVIEATGLPVVLQPNGENAGHETWKSPDGRSITFHRSLVTATRGYGPDLLAMDATGAANALFSGSTASYSRDLRFLGTQYQLKSAKLDCSIAAVGNEEIKILDVSMTASHYTETCAQAGASGKITNEYWIKGGQLLQSRQWSGPGLGHIFFQRLK